MVGLWGSGLTQMRGLWKCPESLSYALAVETGMCSGTETVFSTGLWRISVHLDNRVVRSLGWHSVDQRLMRGSGSLGGLLTVTAASLNCLVWNLESHRSTKENKTLLMVPVTQPGVHHQAVARAQNDGIKRWATGPRVRQCIWSQFGVHSQPQDNCWGPSVVSLNPAPPPKTHTHTNTHKNISNLTEWSDGQKYHRLLETVFKHKHTSGHGCSVDASTKRDV